MNPDSYFRQFVNLEKTGQFRYARTLRRMKRLCEACDHPERGDFGIIAVAGSKGKGSTATMIASVLRASGRRVGLYLSPHIEKWNERIRVNGRLITDAEAVRLIRRWDSVFRGIRVRGEGCTYFECVTALALIYFKQKRVDTVVLETGLGGRFDATNVACADVAVITAIGYEHTAVLGNTLSAIAREKCGIIKAGKQVVASPGQPQVQKVLKRSSDAVHATVHDPRRFMRADACHSLAAGQRFVIRDVRGPCLDVRLGLLGEHQAENALLAVEAARVYGNLRWPPLRPAAIIRGLAHCRLPGRIERVRWKCPVILDGAHSMESARALVAAVLRHLRFKRVWLVIGVFRDKKVRRILNELLKLPVCGVLAAGIDSPRALTPSEFRRRSGRLAPRIKAVRNVAEALGHIRSNVRAGDLVLVTGSMYLAGEARVYFHEN
ncbi:MAG: bifunctional folylpolyglutamate synthase/dihydrofolate synthase [Candidatus Omnitrophica bacterium]|nr:bifunctional folylpolyglutamate synthase/dihydrofolate synthase [Candidatus Omnitrophota bacterium]